MSKFKIVVCTNPDCHLRFPLDLDSYAAKYCPRCGAPLRMVRDVTPNQDLLSDRPKQKRILTVLLDNVRSAYNVGAIFRTADGVGVKKLILCGITPTPNDTPAVAKTALGAEDNIQWEYHPNAFVVAQQLKEDGQLLLALERTVHALSLMAYHPGLSGERSMVLILGNELIGVDPDLLNLCDAVLSIPMSGKKASLNVSVAFGTAAYWLSYGSMGK